MEMDEEGLFSEASEWKSLFLLKIKIKRNPSYPSKKYNAVFKPIHQNIRVYPRSKKKSALINDWKNIIVNWVKSEQDQALANNLGLFQMQFGV